MTRRWKIKLEVRNMKTNERDKDNEIGIQPVPGTRDEEPLAIQTLPLPEHTL